MHNETLTKLLHAQDKKVPVALITKLSDGSQAIVDKNKTVDGDVTIDDQQLEEVLGYIRDDKSRSLGEGEYFVQVFNPKLRMIVIGAVHIAQALAPMAELANFEVTIVDPRGSFASDARFPDLKLMDDWPDEALIKLSPDTRTAVVTLTHDPKLDDPALEEALKTDAFYIASLGSRKTHSKRLERLREKGFDEKMLKRINGPAGLDIGAVSPSEIAISILAELTAVMHQKVSN